MKVFTQVCENEHLYQLLEETKTLFHRELCEIVATLSLVRVEVCDKDGEVSDEPALKCQGAPAIAVVKINSLKDRVEGKADASIFFDGPRVDGMSDSEKKAVFDHELYHLVAKRDKDGMPERDDLNRPKLKMRPHDFQVGWFHAVAERHGQNAAESQQLKALVEGEHKWVQGVFQWG